MWIIIKSFMHGCNAVLNSALNPGPTKHWWCRWEMRDERWVFVVKESKDGQWPEVWNLRLPVSCPCLIYGVYRYWASVRKCSDCLSHYWGALSNNIGWMYYASRQTAINPTNCKIK
jgi:hypothetical protein